MIGVFTHNVRTNIYVLAKAIEMSRVVEKRMKVRDRLEGNNPRVDHSQCRGFRVS